MIFRNEVTNEFLYYVTSFRVIPSGVIKTIELTSAVRQSTSASVKVENPLPYSVTFATECRVPEINLPSQFVVPPNSEVRPGCPGPLIAVTEARPPGPLDPRSAPLRSGQPWQGSIVCLTLDLFLDSNRFQISKYWNRS